MAIDPSDKRNPLNSTQFSTQFPLNSISKAVLKIIFSYCDFEKSFKYLRLVNKGFNHVTREILSSKLIHKIFAGAVRAKDEVACYKWMQTPGLNLSTLTVSAETFAFIFRLALEKNLPETMRTLINKVDPNAGIEKEIMKDLPIDELQELAMYNPMQYRRFSRKLEAITKKMKSNIVNASDSYHNLAFRWACKRGQLGFANELLASGWVNYSLENRTTICNLDTKEDLEIFKFW